MGSTIAFSRPFILVSVHPKMDCVNTRRLVACRLTFGVQRVLFLVESFNSLVMNDSGWIIQLATENWLNVQILRVTKPSNSLPLNTLNATLNTMLF